MNWIQEVIVLSLEGVATIVDRDDAVQHDLVQHGAVIRNDVPHLVLAGGAHESQVAAVEPRLHADSVGNDVGGEAADPSGDKIEPRQAHQEQEDAVEDGYT